jgi:LacI family transcriptional regulator
LLSLQKTLWVEERLFMSKVNQHYIAQQLNLSVTTVSRCFTNHPRINPETRAKVYQLAAELGYAYNAFRNQKQSEQSEKGSIAVLVGASEKVTDAAGVAGKIFTGITQKAAALDFRVELFFVNPTDFRPNMRSRRVIPGSNHNNWAGIVLVFPFREDAVQALSTKFHVISVLDEYDDSRIDSINPDQGRGIAKMVRHLYHLGHRRIGFLSWRYQGIDTPWVETRLGSYVEQFYRLRLPFHTEDVLLIDEVEARSGGAFAPMMVEKIRAGMTAVVCAADHQAHVLILRLREMGLRVPDDLSVTGYDGIPTPIGLPDLTTYSTPFQEVGSSGLVSLQRRIDHPLASRSHILIDGEMIAGDTTRALP